MNIASPETFKRDVLDMSNQTFKKYSTDLDVLIRKLAGKKLLLKHKTTIQRPTLPNMYAPYQVNPRLLQALNYNTTSENSKKIKIQNLKGNIEKVNRNKLIAELQNIKGSISSML